ncbi:MAG: 4Fe-4S dicluster domain-containing protein [Candidatus Zixiibacteriota bacterium]
MRFRFQIIPDKCTGCRSCELACSFSHGDMKKPGKSRIHPLAYAPDQFVPVVCLQCDDPACAKACLFDCITRNPETGAMDIDEDKCVKCEACVAACPFGCALIDSVHDKVVKCDICEGTPACVQFCPTQALVYKRIG